MIQFAPPKMWKTLIQAETTNIKISKYLEDNLRAEQMVWEDLGDFNRDFEITVSYKSDSDHTEKNGRLSQMPRGCTAVLD